MPRTLKYLTYRFATHDFVDNADRAAFPPDGDPLAWIERQHDAMLRNQASETGETEPVTVEHKRMKLNPEDVDQRTFVDSLPQTIPGIGVAFEAGDWLIVSLGYV